jgi:hypothetical protein
MRIRVKLADGRVGSINEEEFNPQSMQLEYGIPQKIVKRIPEVGALLGGGTGAIAGPVGAIGGGAIGGATGYALQNLLEPMVGLKPKESGQALVQAGKEGLKGAAVGALGEGMGWLSGKILSPILSKVGGLLPGSIKKSATNLSFKLGQEIDEAIRPLADKKVSQKTVTDIVANLSKMKESQNYKYNTEALSAIDSVINEVTQNATTLGRAYGKTFEFAKQALNKAGMPKYPGNVASSAEMAAKKYAAPILKSEVAGKTGTTQMMKDYGELMNLVGRIQKGGMGSALTGGALSMLLSPLGPQVAVPGAAIATVMSNPYLRFMGQRIASNALKKSVVPAQAILYELLGLGEQK